MKCGLCRDLGMVIVPGKGARDCECRRKKTREKVVAAVPEKLKRGCVLPSLDNTPAENLHPNKRVADYIREKQEALIPFMRENPHLNYLLAGDNGVGKSHLGYAVYLNAFDCGRNVWAGTVAQLISQYRRFVGNETGKDGQRFYPAVMADDLRKPGAKWTILLDEFDKPNITEFTGSIIFELLNAAQDYGHQIIALSNARALELVEIWGAQDERVGRSIVKRLSENAAGEEIFHRDALKKL
ncbi:MAG TPA: hypothetical protein VF648_18895 [Pyrinomonadaceae bacterium]